MTGLPLCLLALLLAPAPMTFEMRLAPSFEEARAARVVAYPLPGYDGAEDVLDDHGRLHVSADVPAKELTSAQARMLTALLRRRASHDGQGAACFNPHHGFVFFDTHDRVVAHVSICFECNNLWSTPEIKAWRRSTRIETQSGVGFSRSARRRLDRLCRDLGFGHCGE